MHAEPDDALLARYLVGGCSEAERARVEESFFADDEVFARLQQLEEGLIERHLRGELTDAEREGFATAYAGPRRRERVMFTRALQRVVGDTPHETPAPGTVIPHAVRPRPWTRFTLSSGFGLALAAAAMIALLAGVVVIAWQASGLRSSVQSIQADNDTLRQRQEGYQRRIAELERRNTTLLDELERDRTNPTAAGALQRARAVVATFVIAPGLVRSARGPARLTIAPAVDEVRLQLDLEPGVEEERFTAELRDSQARVLWTQEGLSATATAGGGAVIVTVPSGLFRSGEYEIVLNASARAQIEEIGRYYFDVVRN
jgi:hypothetical protein